MAFLVLGFMLGPLVLFFHSAALRELAAEHNNNLEPEEQAQARKETLEKARKAKKVRKAMGLVIARARRAMAQARQARAPADDAAAKTKKPAKKASGKRRKEVRCEQNKLQLVEDMKRMKQMKEGQVVC